MNKKVGFYIGIVLALVLLLWGMGEYREVLETALKRASSDSFWMLILQNLMLVTFGVLMEGKKLYGIIFEKAFQVRWLLAPALLLLTLVLIPNITWLSWTSLGNPFVEIMMFPNTHAILAAATGIVLVRSLKKTTPE